MLPSRRTVLAAGVVLSTGLTALGLACGSDPSAEDTPDASPSDAGNDVVRGSGGDGGGVEPTDQGDGGVPGPDGSPSSGSDVSNPGRVTCGAGECDSGIAALSQELCCLKPAGTPPVCATNPTCQDTGFLRLVCDEVADCPMNGGPRRCCLAFTGVNLNSDCTLVGSDGACTNGRAQLCKTSAECGDAGACALRRCGAYDVRVCGTPVGCN